MVMLAVMTLVAAMILVIAMTLVVAVMEEDLMVVVVGIKNSFTLSVSYPQSLVYLLATKTK
jgi:hypothetical protein